MWGVSVMKLVREVQWLSRGLARWAGGCLVLSRNSGKTLLYGYRPIEKMRPSCLGLKPGSEGK
jgi:hypothetical protein